MSTLGNVVVVVVTLDALCVVAVRSVVAKKMAGKE